VKSVVAALVTLVPLVAAAAGFECLIEPSQVIELRASVDGVIAAVHVQRGDVLRKGQVLVELQSAAEKVAVESARYRAQMEGQITTARNRIDYATKKFERLTDLRQENFASAQALDEPRPSAVWQKANCKVPSRVASWRGSSTGARRSNSRCERWPAPSTALSSTACSTQVTSQSREAAVSLC